MTQETFVAVQYIGRRETFRDHLYGTKLVFQQQQVRSVPPQIARSFLRHQDLFRAPDGEAAQTKLQEPLDPGAQSQTDPETQAALDQAQRDREQQEAAQTKLQDLYDTVARMPKAALVEFAKANYRQELDANLKVGELRDQVRGFIDQFGAI